MTPAPIPPNTVQNITGAIGDVIRAAAVWGAESTVKEPDDRTYIVVGQYTVQLLTIILQREPTEQELAATFGQLTFTGG